MDIHEGVIGHKSENLDAKSMTLSQAGCMVGDGWILVATTSKPLDYVNFANWRMSMPCISFPECSNELNITTAKAFRLQWN